LLRHLQRASDIEIIGHGRCNRAAWNVRLAVPVCVVPRLMAAGRNGGKRSLGASPSWRHQSGNIKPLKRVASAAAAASGEDKATASKKNVWSGIQTSPAYICAFMRTALRFPLPASARGYRLCQASASAQRSMAMHITDLALRRSVCGTLIIAHSRYINMGCAAAIANK